jgi:hypothetical protein
MLPVVLHDIINTYDTFDVLIRNYRGMFGGERLPFSALCAYNYFVPAHWLDTEYDCSLEYRLAFTSSCVGGHLNIAKWLYSIRCNINDHMFIDDAFRMSCRYGHLDVAKWLLGIAPKINICLCGDDAFRNSCRNGHLYVAKWLYSTGCNIHDHTFSEAFRMSCGYGHLDVAKWLLSIVPDMDMRLYGDYVFRDSCCYGHLDVAQWLLSIAPDINIRSRNDYAFRMSCHNNHLEVAQWLLSIAPNIDVSAFVSVTNHIHIQAWLHSITTLKRKQLCTIAFAGACIVFLAKKLIDWNY